MTSPPPDINPVEAFRNAMKKRPYRLVDFPQYNEKEEPLFQFPMVALTQYEQESATAAAAVRYQIAVSEKPPGRNDVNQGAEDLYDNFFADEVLYRACRVPGDVDKFLFNTPMEVPKMLLTDQIGQLAWSYKRVVRETSPLVADMSADQIKEWVELFGKGGADPSNFLDRLSREAALLLLSALVSQQVKLPISSTSSGEAPSEPTI